METILSIKDLNKKFGNIHAVNNLSFDIKKGNVYGILGPNGSGKSTTLGIILNVVNETSGSFSWFDGKLSTHEALKKVGAIIERPNFYPYMTAVQNLKLVCKIKGISFDKIEVKFHLDDRANPTDVFLPILIATFCSTIAGLILVAIIQKINLFQKTIIAYL